MENLQSLQELLKTLYTREMCYPPAQAIWSDDNPTLGMCSITALLVQDLYGGDVCKAIIDGGSHYFNMIDGQIVDLTAEQFGHEVVYDNIEKADRAKMLAGMDTEARYLKLKAAFENSLK